MARRHRGGDAEALPLRTTRKLGVWAWRACSWCSDTSSVRLYSSSYVTGIAVNLGAPRWSFSVFPTCCTLGCGLRSWRAAVNAL